jgi:maleate cis-trans isomerase
MTDSLGHRRKIGVMIPSSNTTCEADFNLVAPGEFSVHGQRLWLTNEASGNAAFERMNQEVESGARYLGTAKVDVVAYGCVMGSVTGGVEADKAMLALIEREAGAPAVATMPATLEALRGFGARRISVATPYPDEKNRQLRVYLEAQGFEVLNIAGEPQAAASGNQGINDQSPESVKAFAGQIFRPEADALLCACTAWRSLEVAGALERDLGKPVVTANQAMLWAARRALGATHPIRGFGRLLEQMP